MPPRMQHFARYSILTQNNVDDSPVPLSSSTTDIYQRWDEALEEYRRSIGIDLRDRSLAFVRDVEECDTVDGILGVLQKASRSPSDERHGRKASPALRECLRRFVRGMIRLLEATAETVSSPERSRRKRRGLSLTHARILPGGRCIFSAAVVLLMAAYDGGWADGELCNSFDLLISLVERTQAWSPDRDGARRAVDALNETLKLLMHVTRPSRDGLLRDFRTPWEMAALTVVEVITVTASRLEPMTASIQHTIMDQVSTQVRSVRSVRRVQHWSSPVVEGLMHTVLATFGASSRFNSLGEALQGTAKYIPGYLLSQIAEDKRPRRNIDLESRIIVEDLTKSSWRQVSHELQVIDSADTAIDEPPGYDVTDNATYAHSEADHTTEDPWLGSKWEGWGHMDDKAPQSDSDSAYWELPIYDERVSPSLLPRYVGDPIAVVYKTSGSVTIWLCDQMTYYGQIRYAISTQEDEHFEHVRSRLIAEWLYVGATLVAIAAIDTAVYGFSRTGTISPIGQVASQCLVLSATSAACGITVNSILLIRYLSANARGFKVRARDRYFGYLLFALFSRLPLLFVSFSGFTLALLLLITAHASPDWRATVVVMSAICVAIPVLVTLQHVFWVLASLSILVCKIIMIVARSFHGIWVHIRKGTLKFVTVLMD